MLLFLALLAIGPSASAQARFEPPFYFGLADGAGTGGGQTVATGGAVGTFVLRSSRTRCPKKPSAALPTAMSATARGSNARAGGGTFGGSGAADRSIGAARRNGCLQKSQ